MVQVAISTKNDEVSHDELGEDATSGTGLLDFKPARWALIYGLPAITCLLAGSAIYVSRMTVDQDIHLLAQEYLRSGGRSAVRIVAYDDLGQPAEKLYAELSLEGEGQPPIELGKAGTAGAPALDIDVTVPELPDGAFDLVAKVATSGQEELVRAKVHLRSNVPGNAKLFLPPPPPDRTGPSQTRATIGDVTLELLPRGAGLVPNMNNIMFLRTTDTQGRPRSTEVGLNLSGGTLGQPLPQTIRTDRLGLAVLSIYPQSNDISIEVSLRESSGGGGTSEQSGSSREAGPAEPEPRGDSGVLDADVEPEMSKLYVPTTPAQMVMRVDQPTPLAMEPFDVRFQSLHNMRPVFVDVYTIDGRWISARTGCFQKAKAGLRLPALPSGLVLVQAYTATLEVGYGYVAHHLYLRERGQDDESVLVAIAEELRRQQIDTAYVEALVSQGLLGKTRRQKLAAAFLLSRLDRGHRQPPLRVSSRSLRSRELEQFQQTFRRKISIAIGILGILVAGLLAYSFTLAAWRAREQRKLFEADLGADENELYVTSMGRPVGIERFRIVMQICLMVGVVALGFLLIALLVSVLNW